MISLLVATLLLTVLQARMRRWICVLAAAFWMACGHNVTVTSVPLGAPARAFAGSVRASMSVVPAGSVEIAPVTAYAEVEDLSVVVEAFKEEVAAVGGDFAKIDRVLLSFPRGGREVPNNRGGSGGTPYLRATGVTAPTRWMGGVETPALTVVGRAFRTPRAGR